MSDTAASPRRKVSREGIVLLKSFEGFRARAERDGDGWVIGYGHRKSARDGLTVGESDAELLLQYDLLPIAAALSAVQTPLNTHQFDALASFIFSVGLAPFLASDVHARLSEGRVEAAADALLAWSEPAPPVSGIRRRAAERALFMADPGRPVALSDLLSAPLPSAPVPVPAPDVSAESRAAAVAALLGEAPAEPRAPYPADAAVLGVAAPPILPTADAPDSPEAPQTPGAARDPASASAVLPLQLTPYGVAVVGPLPGFPPVAQATPASLANLAPSPLPPENAAATESSLDAAAETPLPSVPVTEPVAPSPPASEPPLPGSDEPPAPFPMSAPWSTAQSATAFPPLNVEPLVLTPPPEQDASGPRPVWDEAGRQTPAPPQEPLFHDAPSSVSILRHEEEPTAPRRFDWSETGMYVIMGGLGLVSCAVSAAAFRVAVEDPSPMGETTAVAWTLAVIGAVCVGAASWHLWVRATRR